MRGITVVLINRTQTGVDALNHPIYEEVETEVSNVLVYPTTSDDVIDQTSLEGKKLAYTLGIPKGDTHDWLDCKVRFFGKTFKSYGFPIEGIEAMVPTRWHKKVLVDLYE